MTIKSTGQVGIGNMTPAHPLSLHSATTTNYAQFTTSTTGQAGTNGFLIGLLGANPMFHNQEATSIVFKIGSTQVMNIDPSGNVSIPGILESDGIIDISDERKKEDFAPLNNVFEKLQKIHGVYYRLKQDPTKRKQIGLKAQEVEKVFPEFVTTRKDGMKAVNYGRIVAPLIEAVKSLHQRVSAFEQMARTPASESARIEKLERENAQLKEWICAKDAKAPFCAK